MDINLEMIKDIFSGGWPRNQREQARFDAEQWTINEIKTLTVERDTYKQALDDLGVTPAEAKDGVARSKALLAERDMLKMAHQAHETSNLRMLAKLRELAFENDKLKETLEKIAGIRGRNLSEPWSDAELAAIALKGLK